MKFLILYVNRLSTIHLIILFYLSAVLVSTILLSIPFFHQTGVSLSFTDILFTAVSAISVTGLSVVSTPETFNAVGKVVLAIILQFGGIEIMTLGTFIWIILGKKIGLRGRQLIRIDQNRSTLDGLVKLMISIFKIILITGTNQYNHFKYIFFILF